MKQNPNELGEQVLTIWNERVSAVRTKHKHLRTVILIKANKFDKFAIFEFDTIRYETSLYNWEWNINKNLVAYDQFKQHRFTWQPHGSQFTIIEHVPDEALIIRIKKSPLLNKEAVLKGLGFNKDWIIVKRRGDG